MEGGHWVYYQLLNPKPSMFAISTGLPLKRVRTTALPAKCTFQSPLSIVFINFVPKMLARTYTPTLEQVRQLFERFSSPSAAAVADARFEFFKSSVWPRLAEGGGGGLLLVVPNYFDFIRIR